MPVKNFLLPSWKDTPGNKLRVADFVQGQDSTELHHDDVLMR